jgi:hypothetical protein
LTFCFCNTKFSVMSNSLRPYSDTEVPSYSLQWVLEGIKQGASSLGNLVSAGAGHLGNAVSNIPVVGNVVGDVVTGIGSGVGNLVQGNIGQGLGNLYSAADTALGGMLPGASVGSFQPMNIPLSNPGGGPTGYLSSLYTGADKALGGYLPNFGSFSQYTSPAQAAAQAAAASQMGTGGVPVNGVGNGYGGVAVDQAGNVIAPTSGWDTAGKILNTGAGIASIYKTLTAPKGGGGTQQAQAQYRQMTGGAPGAAIKPGLQGANTGSNTGTAVGGVGGANSRGQGSNATGDLAQVQAGVTEDGAIVGSSKQMEEMVNSFVDQLYESIEEESPSEENTRIINRKKKKRGGATKGNKESGRSSLRPSRRTG